MSASSRQRPHRGRPDSQRPRTGRSRQLVVPDSVHVLSGARPVAGQELMHVQSSTAALRSASSTGAGILPSMMSRWRLGPMQSRVPCYRLHDIRRQAGTFCCGSSDASLARASASSFSLAGQCAGTRCRWARTPAFAIAIRYSPQQLLPSTCGRPVWGT